MVKFYCKQVCTEKECNKRRWKDTSDTIIEAQKLKLHEENQKAIGYFDARKVHYSKIV